MTHFPLTRALTALSMPALCFVLACSDHEGDTSAPTEKSESLERSPQDAASPKLGKHFKHGRRGKHFGGRHHGPGGLLQAAIKHLELSQEQQEKISALKTALRPAKPDDSRPHAALRGLLGEAMKSGKLERSAGQGLMS